MRAARVSYRTPVHVVRGDPRKHTLECEAAHRAERAAYEALVTSKGTDAAHDAWHAARVTQWRTEDRECHELLHFTMEGVRLPSR